MRVSRRTLVLSALAAPWVARAQTSWKPSQAIRLIVPFAPGSTMDPLARLVQEHCLKTFGFPLIIENKPGAATVLGGTEVLRSPADGHTLFMIANSFSANVTLRANRTGNWPNEFEPVVQAAIVPHVLTTAAGIAKDFASFLKYCLHPDQSVTFGSPGTGTSPHLGAEQFAQLAGIKAVHAPYNVISQLRMDLQTSRIQFMFSNVPDVLQGAQEGLLRPLAVAASKRSRELPEVPTLGEVGFPQVVSDSWFGVVVKAAVPEAARKVLEGVWIEALTQADTKRKLEDLGFDVLARPGREFKDEIQKYVRIYADIIKQANIRVE